MTYYDLTDNELDYALCELDHWQDRAIKAEEYILANMGVRA